MSNLLEKINDDKDYFNYLVEKAVVEYLNKLGVSVTDLKELPKLVKDKEELHKDYELSAEEKKKIEEKNKDKVSVNDFIKEFKPTQLEELK